MDVASFLLSKDNEPADPNASTVSVGLWFVVCLCDSVPEQCLPLQEIQKAWSVNLNGYDVEEAKILHLGGKPLNAPEGSVKLGL